MATLALLVGGGPAPGINGVIGAATIYARRRGARVLGIPHGFAPLISGDLREVRELQIEDVSRIHLLGGSILQTSRTNPFASEAALGGTLASLRTLGVDHLITIGGDGTVHVARQLFEAARGRFTLAHVPKTIDNDLPLPGGVPTFGFETAREEGARVVAHLLEDARTTSRWYVVVMMGRDAGHLALGAAKSAGATLALVPEEFPSGPVRLAAVARVIEGAMLKRCALGRAHGVAVVAEGIGARLPEEDLPSGAPRDELNRPRLSALPLGDLLVARARAGLAELGLDVPAVAKDVGYELRCAAPNAFDIEYTRDLGAGAAAALLGGANGVVITRQEHAIVHVPLSAMLDPATGETRKRLLDISRPTYATARLLQVRLEAADLMPGRDCDAICAAAKRTPEELRERYFANGS